MKIYITGNSCISAQPSFEGNFETPTIYSNNRLNSIEPDYKTLIEPKLVRRMSRIMKMSFVTALSALKQANSPFIDAIITGTGYGCLEDTGSFLTKMSDPNNRLMNPTSFIQSTHNTVGSHIALHLNHKGYNNTFVHSGFSFENALDDAVLLMKNNEAQNVLLGGFDELTNDLFTILYRLHAIRKKHVRNIDIFKESDKGYIPGEGATFFVLSNQKKSTQSVEIVNHKTLYNPSESYLKELLNNYNNPSKNILFIIGKNGNSTTDQSYKWFEEIILQNKICYYKHLCGEYPTSSAFGLWLATELLLKKENIFQINNPADEIIIYNCWNKDYHSFIQLQKC